MTKLATLKTKKEFQDVFATKLYIHLNSFTVNYKFEECLDIEHKFGFVITKKVGNAVVRNKIRRRIKEILKKIVYGKDFLPSGSYVFVVKKNCEDFSYKKIHKDILVYKEFL